jgi:hypothetical protein
MSLARVLDRQPHAPGHFVDAAALDAIDAQHEAIGMLALLAQFDKAGDRHAGCGKAQHRMGDQRCLERRNTQHEVVRPDGRRTSSTAANAKTAAGTMAAQNAGSRSPVK